MKWMRKWKVSYGKKAEQGFHQDVEELCESIKKNIEKTSEKLFEETKFATQKHMRKWKKWSLMIKWYILVEFLL